MTPEVIAMRLSSAARAALLSFLDMDEAGVVERVARALCIEHEGEADRQVYKRTGPDTYEPTIKSWERWAPSARAVLSELRKMAGEKE